MVGEVIVSQPTIATVVMRTKTRAIVQGVTPRRHQCVLPRRRRQQHPVFDIRVSQPRSDVGNALEGAIAAISRARTFGSNPWLTRRLDQPRRALRYRDFAR